MASSFRDFVFPGGSPLVDVTFGYLAKEHVSVMVGGVLVDPATYTWNSDSQIQLASSPAAGTLGRVQRTTPSDPLTDFQPGNIDSKDLNNSQLQALYVAVEAYDGYSDLNVRGWVTSGFAAGGQITKGLQGQLASYDASGNIIPIDIPPTSSILLNGMSTVYPYLVETRRYTGVAFQSFVGAADDSKYPLFGPGAIHGRVTAKMNGVIGEVVQDGSNGNSFPIGVLGYGRQDSPGNQVFGGFFRADAYVAGVATHEFNVFNFSANDAPTVYPWSRAFGITTTVPVCLTVAAGGTKISAAGIEIGAEGSQPNAFQYGIVLQTSIKQWSYFQDSQGASGPNSGMYLAIPGDGINLVLKSSKSIQAKNTVIQVADSGATTRASMRQDGTLTLGSGAEAIARLNVAASDTIRGVTNVAAMFGVAVESSPTNLGACVQIGSINGTTPFIAASKYGTGSATISDLIFITNTLERLRIIGDVGPTNGLSVKLPVPGGGYANDAAAASAGVLVGQFYRNGSQVMQRVS